MGQTDTDGLIRVSVLGPLEVLKPGRSRTVAQIDGHKPREILQFLVAARGRVVEKDDLAAALWPTRKPKHVDATIETYVSNLRRSLGSDLLEGRRLVSTTHRGYRLEGAMVDTDLEAFEQLTHRASVATTARVEIELRLEAAALAKAELMPEVRSGWVDPHRDDYLVQRTSNLLRLVDSQLSVGAFAAAIVYAEAALDIDPYLEEAVRLLLVAHYGSGHVSTARTVYERFRGRLAADLHQDPTSASADLAAAIDAGAPIEQLVAGFVGLGARGLRVVDVGSAPDQRRSTPMPFIGRATELAALQQCVDATRAGERRSLLVTGPSGSGKSALLNHVDDANSTMVGRVRYPVLQPTELPIAIPLLDALKRRGEKHLGRSYVDGRYLFADDAALGAMAEVITQTGSMVLLLDDLDRAPSVVISTLRRLFENFPALPLSVIATCKEGSRSQFLDTGANHFDFGGVIALNPLTVDDVQGLGSDAAELQMISGGRPSTMADLWRWRRAGNNGISPSLRKNTLAQLRQRSPTTGELLKSLALMPERVSIRSLADAVGRDLDEVNGELRDLVLDGVIAITDDHVEFAQPILGMVLLEQLRGWQEAGQHIGSRLRS